MNTGLDQERMDAFAQLTVLRNAISNVAANDKELAVIDSMLARLHSRQYTVAVVGEFNRGKSSLINALLGMNVLPADITPTTATINRVVYSDIPCARLIMKNGETEEIPIIMLKGRVTKLSEEAQSAAEKIDEAVIGYPTVFCKNNISILDTPGLNESEEMDDLTFARMQQADALIYMIHALIPFSTSEAEAICRFLSYPNVRHILFTVGFIDKVPEEQRERMISLIRKRILKYTAEIIDADDEISAEEAERRKAIIQDAIVVGVSAKMALDAFVNGSMEQLNASGIEEYKKTLMARLTAQQDEWVSYEIRPYLEKTGATFSSAAERSLSAMDERIRTADENLAAVRKLLGNFAQEVITKKVNASIGMLRDAGTQDKFAQTLKNMIQSKADDAIPDDEENISLVEAFNEGAVEGVFDWFKKKAKDLNVYHEKSDSRMRGVEIGFNTAKLFVIEDGFRKINDAGQKHYTEFRNMVVGRDREAIACLRKAKDALQSDKASIPGRLFKVDIPEQIAVMGNEQKPIIRSIQMGNITIGSVENLIHRLAKMLAEKLVDTASQRMMNEVSRPVITAAGEIQKDGLALAAILEVELEALRTERETQKIQIESMRNFLLGKKDDAEANDEQGVSAEQDSADGEETADETGEETVDEAAATAAENYQKMDNVLRELLQKKEQTEEE